MLHLFRNSMFGSMSGRLRAFAPVAKRGHGALDYHDSADFHKVFSRPSHSAKGRQRVASAGPSASLLIEARPSWNSVLPEPRCTERTAATELQRTDKGPPR